MSVPKYISTKIKDQIPKHIQNIIWYLWESVPISRHDTTKFLLTYNYIDNRHVQEITMIHSKRKNRKTISFEFHRPVDAEITIKKIPYVAFMKFLEEE